MIPRFHHWTSKSGCYLVDVSKKKSRGVCHGTRSCYNEKFGTILLHFFKGTTHPFKHPFKLGILSLSLPFFLTVFALSYLLPPSLSSFCNLFLFLFPPLSSLSLLSLPHFFLCNLCNLCPLSLSCAFLDWDMSWDLPHSNRKDFLSLGLTEG